MQSHPQSRPCSAQPDSVHWRTSSLHRPSSLYGNGLGNGPRLGSGRLGPEDVLVTPTGADLELVNGADSDQITPTSILMPMVTMSESDPIQRQENRCQFRKSYDALL